ncbi:MAG: type II toxin-antitoxin system RelE/ParE family toxin [Bacteroidales bacterium]|nr:type II toxin-antitoxin system RelE/ParE family toxin [Bacteroidales bacterium]
MNVTLHYTPEFTKEVKALSKHYPSFKSDLANLQSEIKQNPKAGADLGDGFRKVRMAIASKGKGKSAGARVITYEVVIDASSSDITLVYIYDKSKRSNITKAEILQIINKKRRR